MSDLADLPHCAYHPERLATTCERCGSFVCHACLEQPGLCGPCAARQAPSRLAVASAIVGGLSFCGFVPGVLAIALGTVELRRIAAGASSARGADWARAGRVLGSVALLLGALLAAVVLLR